MSKSLVDNNTSLLQLTEEIKQLGSQGFLSEQYEDMFMLMRVVSRIMPLVSDI